MQSISCKSIVVCLFPGLHLISDLFYFVIDLLNMLVGYIPVHVRCSTEFLSGIISVASPASIHEGSVLRMLFLFLI
jgi:hypothetical protein